MRILLLAGEASGVLYADGLKARLAGHEVRGYADYGFATHDLAVMGFGAVLRRLPYFMRVRRAMCRAIDEWRPDVLATVDYPGMNMRLAAFARARGIRTVHIVCPQVWAWHQDRIPRIEATFDALCCFFPFEPKLFRPGFASFVGHPLAYGFAARPARTPGAGPLVALLPGSRRGEIEKILPGLLAAARLLARDFPSVRFAVPAATPRAREQIAAQVAASGVSAEVMSGGARELLLRADCAAVASGTATLEAALARCPTVLVYRVGAAFAWLARRVIRGTRYIGLANIVWDRCGTGGGMPMPELLQEDFTPEAVAGRLGAWLRDADARAAAVRRLEATVRLLETGGDPLARCAEQIVQVRTGGRAPG